MNRARPSPESADETSSVRPRRAPAKLPVGLPRTRPRAADHVFESLAGAILRGELEPGAALPPEREIAERFSVSPIVARDALHRLKELGLVQIRQGSPTLVQDPELATDLRIVLLAMELAPRGSEDERDLTERLLLSAASLLELAERRIRPDEVGELERLLVEYASATQAPDAHDAFEERYWTLVARATRNRIYQTETRWWFSLADRRPPERRAGLGDAALRIELYRGINQRLMQKTGAASFYLSRIRLLLA